MRVQFRFSLDDIFESSGVQSVALFIQLSQAQAPVVL